MIEQLALLCRRELAEAVEQQLIDRPSSRPQSVGVGKVHHESVTTLCIEALAIEPGKFNRQFIT